MSDMYFGFHLLIQLVSFKESCRSPLYYEIFWNQELTRLLGCHLILSFIYTYRKVYISEIDQVKNRNNFFFWILKKMNPIFARNRNIIDYPFDIWSPTTYCTYQNFMFPALHVINCFWNIFCQFWRETNFQKGF